MHDMWKRWGKYPNLSSSHRSKNMLLNAAEIPNNNTNPLGAIRKNVYYVESLQFFGKVEISLYSKNHSGAILIGLGDT